MRGTKPVILGQSMQYEGTWFDFGKTQLLSELSNPLWSIEYLAAHLDVAKNPADATKLWPVLATIQFFKVRNEHD